MMKVIDELCGIEQAYITTIHSYTTGSKLARSTAQRFT
jgi:glyceraldehyde 3-phosphate dehydrogenase